MNKNSEIFTIKENPDHIRCQGCWIEFVKDEKYIIKSSGHGLFPEGTIVYPIHKSCDRELTDL